MRISDWSSDVCSSDLTFIPETVTPYLRRSVAAELGIKPYEVWRTIESATAFKRRLRRCLFVGLSDGSRIDVLRRANAGRLSQEQIIPMMNVDDEKWKSLAKDLKDELRSEEHTSELQSLMRISYAVLFLKKN